MVGCLVFNIICVYFCPKAPKETSNEERTLTRLDGNSMQHVTGCVTIIKI